jgi:hypothetical protein
MTDDSDPSPEEIVQKAVQIYERVKLTAEVSVADIWVQCAEALHKPYGKSLSPQQEGSFIFQCNLESLINTALAQGLEKEDLIVQLKSAIGKHII